MLPSKGHTLCCFDRDHGDTVMPANAVGFFSRPGFVKVPGACGSHAAELILLLLVSVSICLFAHSFGFVTPLKMEDPGWDCVA